VRTRLYASLALAVLLAVLVQLSSAQPAVAAADDVVVLTAVLTGEAEVPPADLDGIGAAGIVVFPRRNLICYTLAVHKIEPATAAHIHAGAAGVNGPVVVPLSPPTRGFSAACVTSARAGDIANNPADFYVNVHNTPFGGGAIRGQLKRLGH
jgi:hypothetical protein